METLADKLSPEQQEQIHSALAETTLKHVSANSGLFGELAFDPIKNPSQDLRNVHLLAVPTDPTELDSLATLANDRLYPYIRDELFTQGALVGELRKMRNDARERSHVSIVSTHQTMPDIGEVEVAFSIAEKNNHDTDWQTIVNTNGLIISRGVSTLQAFGLAASEVVQKAGYVFYSFPRTKTIKDLVLPEDINLKKLMSDNNSRMRKELKNWLPVGVAGLGSALPTPGNRDSFHSQKKRTFIAWSGATDKVTGDPFNPDRIQIERANTGIYDHVRHGVVLPLVVWDRGKEEEPIFITGELTKVSKKSDIAEIQEWQRCTLAKRLDLSDELVTVA